MGRATKPQGVESGLPRMPPELLLLLDDEGRPRISRGIVEVQTQHGVQVRSAPEWATYDRLKAEYTAQTGLTPLQFRREAALQKAANI